MFVRPTAVPLAVAILCLGLFAAPSHAQIPTRNVTVLAHFDEFAHTGLGEQNYSACWSYIHSDGREYALLGVAGAQPYDTPGGTAIYNVTNPAATYRVAFIPGPQSFWHEMKSYRDWAYITSEGEGAGQGLQIVRMTDPEHPVLVGTYTIGFTHSHTVSIDTTRAILICNGTRDGNGIQTGMRVLSLANPEAPVEIGMWPPQGPPVPLDLYVHDCVVVGNRLYASSIYGGYERVLEFTDPAHPTELSSWTTPGHFTHSAWPDPSGRFLYVTDEVTGKMLSVYDLANLSAPTLTYAFMPNPVGIVHNPHVLGDELYLSSYTEGIRVLDLQDPAHPAEFAYADSYLGYSGGFNGVWEVCPYFPSGTVIASDRQSGLWVYRVTRNYGTIRARVVDAGTGQPLANQVVYLDRKVDSLVTLADGVARYAPDPGSRIVTAYTFGWTTAFAKVDVTQGSADAVTLAVSLKPTVPFTGQVTNAVTGAPLDDAEVRLVYTPLHVHTEEDGYFSFSNVPDGDYRVDVKCPGYLSVTTLRHIGPGFGGQNFELVPAPIYDPLETDTGWSVFAPGDNAVYGRWVWAEPHGTGYHALAPAAPSNDAELARGGAPPMSRIPPPRLQPLHEGIEGDGAVPGEVQPDHDRTPGTGTLCFVTGNGDDPNNPDAFDLDGGKTTLTSHSFDMTGMTTPTLAYWRWFYGSPPDPADYLLAEISNDGGQSWTAVDTTRGVLNDWDEATIRVADYVTPTNQVKLRFVAADEGDPLTVVEAAIDDVIAYDAVTQSVGLPPSTPMTKVQFRAPRPNPAIEHVHLTLELPTQGDVTADVLDLQGRRVRKLHRGSASAGLVRLEWDGKDDAGHPLAPGLYFARAEALGETTKTRFVLAR
jgi:choice-of-anchor B domain-containing protein